MADTGDDEQTIARKPQVTGGDGVPDQAATDERLAERRQAWIAVGRSADDIAAEQSAGELAAGEAEEEQLLVEERLELGALDARELRETRRKVNLDDAELA